MFLVSSSEVLLCVVPALFVRPGMRIISRIKVRLRSVLKDHVIYLPAPLFFDFVFLGRLLMVEDIMETDLLICIEMR